MMEEARILATLVRGAQSVVFFGGAGVSTESGIPDFRSAQGLYAGAHTIPPEQILSHSFLMQHPEAFYGFYREKMLYPEAQPNAAHRVLAKWEAAGKLTAVVTQNIDGLHQLAGSTKVWELHGSVNHNHCLGCGRAYGLDWLLQTQGVPHCDCGGMVRPDVVLYEEGLDGAVVQGALRVISAADLLIVGGTSLTVYPAAGFVEYCRGKLVILNKTATRQDLAADLVVHASVGEALSASDRLL